MVVLFYNITYVYGRFSTYKLINLNYDKIYKFRCHTVRDMILYLYSDCLVESN